MRLTWLTRSLICATLTALIAPAVALPCSVDSDCTAGNWCNESVGMCTAQLADGSPMPTDPPHTNPVLNGMCTPAAGVLVCQSGVCDPADNKCGVANPYSSAPSR